MSKYELAKIAKEIREIKAQLNKESGSPAQDAKRLGYEVFDNSGEYFSVGVTGLNGYPELSVEVEENYHQGMMYVNIDWAPETGLQVKDIKRIKGFIDGEGMRGNFSAYVKTEGILSLILKDLMKLYRR